MTTPRGARLTILVLSAAALAPLGARAHADAGTVVPNVEMRTLSGARDKPVSPRVRANVLVFVRPDQDRSVEALKAITACAREFAAKPVRFVAVMSASSTPDEIRATLQKAGATLPVILDDNDALYGALDIRLHPMVAFVDGGARLAATEMYRQLDYADVIKGRVRLMLGEIDAAAIEKILNPEASTAPGADLEKKAMRDVNMARRMLAMDDADSALQAAQRGIEVAPIAAAYSVMGEAWAKKGNCAEARKAFAEALKRDPADAKAAAGQKACAGK